MAGVDGKRDRRSERKGTVWLAENERGIWEICWVETDAEGRYRQRRQSCKTRDKDVAEKARQIWLLSLSGSLAGAEALAETVRSVGDLAAAYMRDKGFDARVSAQAYSLRNWLGVFGAGAVVDLTRAGMAAWRDQRETEVAGPTVRRELGAVRALFGWAEDKPGLLPEGWTLPGVEMPGVGHARTRYLSDGEAEVLWAAALNEFDDRGGSEVDRRAALFVLVALETAARLAAIRGLTWDRVDLAGGFLDFRDPGMEQTNKRRVAVPVSDRLRPVLERALAECRDEGRVSGRPGRDFVLLGSRREVRPGFERLRGKLVAAGLVHHFTIHDIRRTWATLRMQWGVPIGQVAGVLGDSIEVTEKHYAHHSPGYLRDAVNVRGRIGAA